MYQSCDVHSVYDQYEIDGVFKSCFIFLSNNSNALTVVSECVCVCVWNVWIVNVVITKGYWIWREVSVRVRFLGWCRVGNSVSCGALRYVTVWTTGWLDVFGPFEWLRCLFNQTRLEGTQTLYFHVSVQTKNIINILVINKEKNSTELCLVSCLVVFW